VLTITLTDQQWQKILPFLRSCRQIHIGSRWQSRRFLSAVLWISRSGAQWRLLPKEYCDWNSVYKRFARWADSGVFEQLHQFCAADPDFEHLLIDSAIIRVHPCAAGALKKRRSASTSLRLKSRWLFD